MFEGDCLIVGVDGMIHDGRWSDRFRYGQSYCEKNGEPVIAMRRCHPKELGVWSNARMCKNCFEVLDDA